MIIEVVPRFQTSYRRILLRSKYFDGDFYRRRYPDVAAAGMQAFAHYLKHGAGEGRKPNAWFDPDYYLARSSAARERGGDPFVDYLVYGRREGAVPHPLGAATAGAASEGSLFECAS